MTPSKMCRPRVKTFEDFPLEAHPQKAPQVNPTPSHPPCKRDPHPMPSASPLAVIHSQDNQTDSGMILASEELKRLERQQAEPVSKM